MNPLDTIKNIINKGKEGVLFQSPNPLLRAIPAKPKTPVVFGIPSKPTATPIVPSTANTTRQTVAPVPMQAPVVPQPPINPIDIIRNGKQAVLRQDSRPADPSSNQNTLIRKVPVLGALIAGKGKNSVYEDGTFPGFLEKNGALGFFMDGLKRYSNPDRAVIAERVMAKAETLIASGTPENEAYDKAIKDLKDNTPKGLDKIAEELTNKRTGNNSILAIPRALDELSNPNVELSGKEQRALLPGNVGTKLMAGLDALGVGGTTKNVGKGAIKTILKGKELDIAEQAIDIARGTSKLDKEAQKDILKKAQDIADREQFPNRVGGTKALANDFEAVLQNKPFKAEPLQEEAKKYKSVDEFVRAIETPISTAKTGTPITSKVYHGSPDARFAEEFDPQKLGYYPDAPDLLPDNTEWNNLYGKTGGGFRPESATGNKGVSFTDSLSTAKSYSNKPAFDYSNSVPMVLERYVTLRNPKVYDLGGKKWDLNMEQEMRKALDEGHDGLVFKNILDDYHPFQSNKPANNIIALDVKSIKTSTQLEDIWKQANTKQKPNKMADYRAGKPNLEGGYIRNPLAGKGETPKSNNQVVSSGNDSIKPKSATISYETKLRQRIDLLRQVPNKTARVQRELQKKSWKLSDLMSKKTARAEKLSQVRDTKIVDKGVKERINLASNADETRSLSKIAEEQGLYESQRRNLTPDNLAQRRLELQLEKDALDNDPARELGQFVSKSGEFKGTLPEQVTTKGGFGLDERITNAGFKSSEEARDAYQSYKQRKVTFAAKQRELSDDIKIARGEKKAEQTFEKAVSPIESLTKKVATNASKVTKRVEQKATKRQVDFEKREAKRQVATTKKVYGEKIKDEKLNTQFVKRAEQKVAVRQVQFEKREARRQVTKAKAELVDKMRVTNANIDAIKADVVNYAKQNLPVNQIGKFISAVKNAKTQKDAIKAFFRIDNLVTEIQKKTLIRDIQKSVANLPASVEIGYSTKIKELVSEINLKGYSKATVQKLEDTQKYLAEQKKLGKDVELPTRLLEKLKILGRTDAKNLTVSQLQGIQDEIDLLKHLGQTKQRIKTNLYEAEKTYIAEDLISTAKPLSYKEIKTTPGVAQSLGIKTANKVKQVLNRLKKARLSIRPIDGLAEATGMEQVKNRIDLSYSNYLDKLDDFAKQREVIVDKLQLKDTNMERIGIYAAKQQAGGYEKLANLGISQEAADAIKLTDAEQEYYEFGRKMFDEDFDEVKAYMQDVYNKDVGKVDNYVSFQTDFNAMSELEIYDRFGTLADDAVTRTKTVKKDFTESRTGSGGQKIKLNFDSILIRHKDNVSYMLNMGKDIKMYSEVLNSPELREKLGDLGTYAWKEYMSLMARKGGVDSQKQIATIDMLRRNLGVGVMAYKLSTALVQVSSLADAAATIGSKWVSVGVYDIASSRTARKFVIDNFPEIREMIGDDIAFLELGDDWLGKVQQAGFTPLRKLDALMRSTSAIAAYKKLASEAGIAADFAKPNKDIIQKATKLVRQSQGSSSFKDSPLALTTGAFTGNVSVDKAIFQFQSFMLNRWENIERQIWREGFGSGNYVKGFTAVFWMVVAAGIIEESSRRVSRGAVNLITGEDKEEDPFIETVIGNTVKNVPIAGNIMNSLAYDSNPVPFINAAESTLGGYKRAYTGVETSTKVKGAIDAGLGTANLLFGIPGTVQAGQLIKPFIGKDKGTGDKELDAELKQSKETTKATTEKATTDMLELAKLTPDEQKARLQEIAKTDKDYAIKLRDKLREQNRQKTWSEVDKGINKLGVENGARANYVYKKMKELPGDQRNAYIKDLRERKVISDEVYKQIQELHKNRDIIE